MSTTIDTAAPTATAAGHIADINHYIDGHSNSRDAARRAEVFNPATGQVTGRVALGTVEDVEAAVAAAARAFPSWSTTPPHVRARVMFRFRDLVEQHADRLAAIITAEHGKVLSDAKGEVTRGLEVVEFACGIPQMLKGEFSENVGRAIDGVTFRQPLGVVAGISPFNFPAMVPMWMFPVALACGNTFVMKPSEKDPTLSVELAALLSQAGLPDGVFNVVHGDKVAVDALLAHPDVEAISFVGSTPIAEYIHATASGFGKRVQALGGAKNHMVIMPDANKDQVLSNLLGASCGAAGQRCMAISVAVFVGAAREWIPELAAQMAELKPGHWQDAHAAYGPLISQQAKQRVQRLIAEGKAEGADCLLDGSHCEVAGFPDGNWLGPTLFRGVTTKMGLYREEIFGPVLACMEVDDLNAAIELVNASPYGNGTSIFTRSGGAARHFQHAVEVGQVGINVPIPVPLPFFSFTGWKGSFYGDLHAYGKQAVRFYTETKTVTSRWFDDSPVSGPNMTIQLK